MPPLRPAAGSILHDRYSMIDRSTNQIVKSAAMVRRRRRPGSRRCDTGRRPSPRPVPSGRNRPPAPRRARRRNRPASIRDGRHGILSRRGHRGTDDVARRDPPALPRDFVAATRFHARPSGSRRAPAPGASSRGDEAEGCAERPDALAATGEGRACSAMSTTAAIASRLRRESRIMKRALLEDGPLSRGPSNRIRRPRLGLREAFRLFENDAHHRSYDELGDPHAARDDKGLCPMVHQHDPDLAAIVRIDRARRVQDGDPVLQRKAERGRTCAS